jgi:exodeoxyribonuclease VII large subunit
MHDDSVETDSGLITLPERKIYTVSQLTDEIRFRLEAGFPSVWVRGEISNFKCAVSGHMYFTLKDDAAQIRCVIFRQQNRLLKFKPDDGLQIICWGRLSVYGPRGEYQLILDTIEPEGLGSLMLALEQLKKRLAAEGLFDPARKKPIPPFPKTVGLVTSLAGAAVRDMIRIMTRRLPSVNILVTSTTVQGDRAPQEIQTGIERLSRAADVDVIILGRGGGSAEDLWAFNDERVVRAVADCPLPTVSAVGHETDFTLTDFAADLRASTPSAAAELVVQDKKDLAAAVQHLVARLGNSAMSSIQRRASIAGELIKRLHDPRRRIGDKKLGLDDLSMRLTRAMNRKLESAGLEHANLAGRLRPESLTDRLSASKQELSRLVNRLSVSGAGAVKEHRADVERLSAGLSALSPLAVLERGYSITFDIESGKVVRDASAVRPDGDVKIRLHKGELLCQVIEKMES